MPREIWQRDSDPVLTARQANEFKPRRERMVRRIYDQEAVGEFLAGKISREEMLRRIRR